MNQNLFKAIIACGIVCFIACTTTKKAETEKWSERMARSEMKRFPEPWMIEKAKKPRWGYTHGLVVKSVPAITKPLINGKAKLNKIELTETYLYDLPTKAGKEYILIGK